ncbi:hypothetical protein [Nostoc sp.]|uniref:hypothetical protein n=1 Tax=Nostoc sp. TaxID=1180 RepID=UPI002FF4936A
MKDASVPSPLRMAGANERSLMQLIIQSSSSSFTSCLVIRKVAICCSILYYINILRALTREAYILVREER